jgi:hypothetical protein
MCPERSVTYVSERSLFEPLLRHVSVHHRYVAVATVPAAASAAR